MVLCDLALQIFKKLQRSYHYDLIWDIQSEETQRACHKVALEVNEFWIARMCLKKKKRKRKTTLAID